MVAFTEAVMSDDPATIDSTRRELRERLDDAAFVDVCAVIGAFNVVTRIADATGIPLDDMMVAASADTRETLGLNSFDGADNTPSVSSQTA